MRFALPHAITASTVVPVVVGSWIWYSWRRDEPTTTSCDGFLPTETSTSATKSSNDDGKSFHGQCPKRQLWRPEQPYPLWNYDWDGRMTNETTLEALKAAKKGEKVPGGVTRHILLIRHGQYDETHKEDEKRKLTELGRAQADLTGKRLATMAGGINETFGPCKIKVMRVSGMLRARETADIISKHLPDNVMLAEPDPLLNEGIPAQIIPIRPEIDSEKEFDEHHERIESAFKKYFFRADPLLADQSSCVTDTDDQHEFEIIVCHGNVIRYFFCRALQLPPEAWLRLSLFNCSLTYLMIKPNGTASCRLLGDVGHLGYDHTSFSMGHGFAW